jgi:hypothetical protein
MTLPDFLFIGPDKTGSSWLYELLRHHPQCYVPECKDIYFFDRHYERGMNWYGSFFGAAPADARAIGELSHDYLFSEAAAERIRRELPGVRLIASLRDPAERTFSHYLYMIRSGRTRLPFEAALEKFPELIDNSLYHKHLSHYFERFEAAQIKVLWFDDLKDNPRRFGEECLDFLGLDRCHGFDYRTRVREASSPRSYWLAKTLKMGANLARAMRMERLVGALKHGLLARVLYRPYRKGEKPVLDAESRARLDGIFESDIARLERMLNVDLGHWQGRGDGAMCAS